MEPEHDLPAHHVDLAAEIRRLGNAAMERSLDPIEAAEIRRELTFLSDRLERRPVISKVERVFRRHRIADFLETGTWSEPPENGSRLDFDPTSFVGGELNPFSTEARYYCEGEEAAGYVKLGACYEGPPGRAHGGVICAVFDEVMGSVFHAIGAPAAFTGELSVRFDQPAPLNTELEFRARLVKSEGRRQLIEGEARSPEGRFATATATFIEMKTEHLVDMQQLKSES